MDVIRLSSSAVRTVGSKIGLSSIPAPRITSSLPVLALHLSKLNHSQQFLQCQSSLQQAIADFDVRRESGQSATAAPLQTTSNVRDQDLLRMIPYATAVQLELEQSFSRERLTSWKRSSYYCFLSFRDVALRI